MCETTYYMLWNRSAATEWVNAMGLLVFPFSEPYLLNLGVSEDLRSSIHILREISQEILFDEYFFKKDEIRYYCDSPAELYAAYGEGIRFAILKILNQFTEATQRTKAIEVDHWIRRHFFCGQLSRRIETWETVFSIVAGRHNVSIQIDLLPELERILPFIEKQFPEAYDSFSRSMNFSELARKYYDAHSIEISSDVLTRIEMNFYDISRQVKVIQIFQKIAFEFSHREKQKIVSWAVLRLNALSNIRWSEIDLYGDRMFTTELPCSNTPSILDLPDLD
jgi:hypothetical protein